MIFYPNAKINIGLEVIKKRKDSYHDINTVFYPIPLCDILEIIENHNYIKGAAKCNLQLSGIVLDGNAKDNLVVKAYSLLDREFDLSPVSCHLHKIIPSGAGLGGGSSDASFMLMALNAYFDLGLNHDILKKYALEIGSDCAFFIDNEAAFAKERGDKLSPIDICLKGRHILLIHPGIHISTADAYQNVKLRGEEASVLSDISNDISKWKSICENDFEPYVFSVHPIIREIKEQLYQHGALFALMSGSGSAVYGFFEDPPSIDWIDSKWFVWKAVL